MKAKAQVSYFHYVKTKQNEEGLLCVFANLTFIIQNNCAK
jgi:hypothetical protein